MLKDYIHLTKPGLVLSNVAAVAGGFALATRGMFHWPLFAACIAGTGLVMASGCVFNNYIDRDIDAAMERTRHRPLPAGRMSGLAALVLGSVLGVLGFAALIILVPWLAASVAMLGFLLYVFMYSLWFRRRSAHGTLVGGFAGATPPVVGYVALANRLDLAAALLFATLVAWQMAHFYSIAVYRVAEYRAAGIPVFPAVYGVRATKMSILAYVLVFTATAALLTAFGYAGKPYLVLVLALGVSWIAMGIRGFAAKSDTKWGKRMYGFSIFALSAVFAAMIAEAALRALNQVRQS
jgi:heme o synthase